MLLERLRVAAVHPVLPNAPPHLGRTRIVKELIEDPMAKILADRVSAAAIAPHVHREVFSRERRRVLDVSNNPNLSAEVLGVHEAVSSPTHPRDPFVVRRMIPEVLYARVAVFAQAFPENDPLYHPLHLFRGSEPSEQRLAA
jgi:hypothetical protein